MLSLANTDMTAEDSAYTTMDSSKRRCTAQFTVAQSQPLPIADQDKNIELHIFDSAMSITNSKPFQPAVEDAEIGLEIFDSSALPAERSTSGE